MGRRKLPIWGVVATDTRSPRDGRFIEDLGRYYPLEEPARVELNGERVMHWLEVGAQPSPTVRSLLSKQGYLLALHLKQKGTSEEAIQQAVEAHRNAQAQKALGTKRVTVADRRKQALEEERARAAKLEAEEAAAQAKAEAERQRAEEAARKAAAEARAEAKAAEAAKAAAEEAAKEEAAKEAAKPEAQAVAEAAEPEAEAPAETEAAAEAAEPEAAEPEAPAEEAAATAEADAEDASEAEKGA